MNKINAFLKDNLRSGMVLGILSVLATFWVGGPIVGSVIGLIGFSRNRKAIKEGHMWGMLGGLLCVLPIFYLIFLLFIVGNTLF